MILSSIRPAIAILGLAIGFASPLWSQEPTPQTFELKGIIRDQNGTVFPGLRIRFKSERGESASGFTDLNGEFYERLQGGEFIVSADSLSSSEFRAYLRIGATYQNPGYLEFIVNWDRIDCVEAKSKPFPRVINAAEPVYPAPARAVRAGGEVTVLVKISPEGLVQSSTGISGHPLLRRAAEVAAGKYRFEPNPNDMEREAQLTFVFLPDQDKRQSVSRMNCPNRVVVVSIPVTIETTNSN